MKKLMTVVAVSVCAVSLAVDAVAAEETKPETKPEEGLEQEDPKIFSAWLNVDFMSAYVWRNTVCNDDLVIQPSVGADLTYFEPFYLGFSVWQGYNLTHRQCEVLTHGLTETDYNVHLGSEVWKNEDGDMALNLEIGHEWYDMNFVRDGAEDVTPDTREIYVRADFSNPIVDVYGQVSWKYEDFGDYKSGVHYEIGFNRAVEVYDSVSVGADWNVSFGDGHYLETLYGNTASPDGTYSDTAYGFGGTTIKLYTTWQVTSWFSLMGQIAYTGVLNGAYREAIGDMGDDYCMCGVAGESYPRDFVWGGITAKFEF